MDSHWFYQATGRSSGSYDPNNTENMVDLTLRLGLPNNDHAKNDQPQFGQYVIPNLMATQPSNLHHNILGAQVSSFSLHPARSLD